MTPDAEELLAGHIKQNPDKTYRQVAARLKVSDLTISSTAIKHGVRKIRIPLTIEGLNALDDLHE